MSHARAYPTMTQAEFFAWEPPDDRRYEFDGFAPVAMTGGTNNHNLICQNLWAALRSRLRGTACRPLGPDVGLQTIGSAVRYPDALVTCSRVDGTARLVEGAVVVFEVLSPSSEYVDHVDKLREYQAVPTIRRYVQVQQRGVGLTVLEREADTLKWTVTSLKADDTLCMPEIGMEMPVGELYDGVELPVDGSSPRDREGVAED